MSESSSVNTGPSEAIDPAQTASAPAEPAGTPGIPAGMEMTEHGLHHAPGPFFSLRNVLWVGFFLILTGLACCANWRSVFSETAGGMKVFFADGDCYARMTRVRYVLEHGRAVHYHPFENHPAGTLPHTTAPMDFLIAALALLLKPFVTEYIDVAGAIVSPVLGVMTTAFLALWARKLNQQYRRLMLLLASLSPMLIHGMALGRPDHQSLQVFLVAVALGAELIMARRIAMNWSIVSGLAWGLGLWVSLYEPLVLLLVIYFTKLIFYRSHLFVRERLWGLGALLLVLGCAWLVEGPWVARGILDEAHDPAMRDYFMRWTGTIAEMESVNSQNVKTLSLLLFHWVGLGLLAAPLLLIARLKDTRRSTLLLTLLTTTFVLTLLQIRWGYFFSLIFVMSLPWQLSLFTRKWMVIALFLMSLWPVAGDWDYTLFDHVYQDLKQVELADQKSLRAAAEVIREKAPGGIMAPWWWSPQLAYWSGQPAVAGSSHESLGGIVDTARFFSATDPKAAQEVCDARKIETVVAGNPGRILEQSLQLLGQPRPLEKTMADILWQTPDRAPLFLHILTGDYRVKIYEVNHGAVIR